LTGSVNCGTMYLTLTRMENKMPREKNISIWSVEEFCPKFDWMLTRNTIRQLIYAGNVIYFPEKPSKRRIKGACETLMRKSDDRHHIYIENLRDLGNGIFRMECGS